jgi:hypothetical protein
MCSAIHWYVFAIPSRSYPWGSHPRVCRSNSSEPRLTDPEKVDSINRRIPSIASSIYRNERVSRLTYLRNYETQVRVARFNNIFGPVRTWRSGRGKAPAAICRKVAEAPDGGRLTCGVLARSQRDLAHA